MATRTSVTASVTIEPDVTGDITIYGTKHLQASIMLTAGAADPWGPAVAFVYATDPDALVKLADIVLEGAEQLRAAQREQAVAGSEAA